MGGVEAFTAQQGSNVAGMGRGSISLCQDGQFVLGSEGPTPGDGDDFRVRPRRAGRLGRDGFARPSTAAKTVGEAEEIPLIFKGDFVSRPAL